MGFFDRFSSRQGKADKKTAPKSGAVTSAKKAEEAKQKAFAAVGSGQETRADKSKASEAPAAKPVKKESTQEAYRILLGPVVTEKSSLIAKSNQYSFAIAHQATKADVKNAVHHVYGVRPTAVNIIKLPGKYIRYGRYYGRQAVRKKAIVTLPAGKSIDVFSTQ